MKVRGVNNISLSFAAEKNKENSKTNIGKYLGTFTGVLFTATAATNAHKEGVFDDMIRIFKENPSASKLPAIGSCLATAVVMILPFFCVGALFDKIANNKNQKENSFVKQA